LERQAQAQVDVTLAWNASTTTGLAGYYLVWGAKSGVYYATNVYPATQTSGTITNLEYSIVYYINVAAFSSNGTVSPYAGEITFSSNAPVETTNNETNMTAGTGGGPPAPPGPGTGAPAPGTSTASTTTGSGSASSSAASSTNATQAQIWGIPPVLNLVVTNDSPTLNIGGTVGATVMVQSTTNPAAAFSWTTLTNVALTNIAQTDTNAGTGQPQDAIDLAYVPAAQTTFLPTSVSSTQMQFFRVIMPYDYIILAGSVLPTKGYPSRLILVNMPGLNDDACYVTQSASFIHYNQTNSTLQLEASGSTIRQIASTLSSSLNLDWTTASEFVYSNGVGQILATVVEADPASSDPVAGTTPTSTININF
jgi:hypothetical protein